MSRIVFPLLVVFLLVGCGGEESVVLPKFSVSVLGAAACGHGCTDPHYEFLLVHEDDGDGYCALASTGADGLAGKASMRGAPVVLNEEVILAVRIYCSKDDSCPKCDGEETINVADGAAYSVTVDTTYQPDCLDPPWTPIRPKPCP